MAESAARRGARLRAALLRATRADRAYPALVRALTAPLADQARWAAAAAADGHDVAAALESQRPRCALALREALLPRLRPLVIEGYGLAGVETGTAAPTRGAGLSGKSTPPGSGGAGAGPGDTEWQRFVQRNDWGDLEKWVKTTAESASRTGGERLLRIYERARDGWIQPPPNAVSGEVPGRRGLTPREIADAILRDGLTQSESRARMLAHTGTIWAVNEGAVARYADDGIAVVEWLTADDDLRCPACATMHGKRVETREPFLGAGETMSLGAAGSFTMWAGGGAHHPPLHPNCRCTVIPVVDATAIAQEPPGPGERPLFDQVPNMPLPTVTAGPEISTAFIGEVKAIMDRLPQQVRVHLQRRSVHFELGRGYADIDPDVAKLQPRGYPTGSTWANADGSYSSGTRTVRVLESHTDRFSGSTVPNRRVGYVTAHEIGHAFDCDDNYRLSSETAFKVAYRDEAAKLPPEARAELEYFLQMDADGSDNPGREEMFAEICGMLLRGRGRPGAHDDTLKKWFKKTIAVVRGKV